MPTFSFVLTETETGKADRQHHMNRRNLAKTRLGACTLAHDVTETMIPAVNGDLYFFWVLNAPNRNAVDSVIRTFTVDHTKVRLFSGPADVTIP
jgi:hypothetical protein